MIKRNYDYLNLGNLKMKTEYSFILFNLIKMQLLLKNTNHKLILCKFVSLVYTVIIPLSSLVFDKVVLANVSGRLYICSAYTLMQILTCSVSTVEMTEGFYSR